MVAMNEPIRRKPAEVVRLGAGKGAPDALPFRAAPHNLEAEQALLGAILVNNEAHDRVSSFLEAHHFYDPLHQQIFETLSKLIASGKQATPITLRTFFETAGRSTPRRRCPCIWARLPSMPRPSSTRATMAARSTISSRVGS
jgi:DnaB helicase-like protein